MQSPCVLSALYVASLQATEHGFPTRLFLACNWKKQEFPSVSLRTPSQLGSVAFTVSSSLQCSTPRVCSRTYSRSDSPILVGPSDKGAHVDYREHLEERQCSRQEVTGCNSRVGSQRSHTDAWVRGNRELHVTEVAADRRMVTR